MRKVQKRMLATMLAVFVIAGSIPMDALAKISNGTDFGYNRVVSSKEYAIAPGITETDFVLNNDNGDAQNKVFSMEVDLSNPNTHLVTGYKDYQSTSWGLQTVTEQAAAAEKALKKKSAYGEDTVVVGGINGGFFNMATGQPEGAFVMDGKIIQNTAPRNNYFAVLNDGTAEIRMASEPVGSDVKEAIAGAEVLVHQGNNQVGESHDGYGRVGRTAVGIKEDGKVVLFVVDGRQAPTSFGMTLYEVAEAMIGLGCVEAINLDGGGSTTFASRREGSDKLSVISSPSDGAQRGVSTTLLVASTAKPSGVFDHATISPKDELYTPGTIVQFEAKGVDSSGKPVEIPEGVSWSLDVTSQSLGTIDAKTGLFTAGNQTGEVTVQLILDGKVVGSTNIEIVTPDSISFASDEISLGFTDTTDFGIIVKNKGREINYKVGDLNWTVSDPKMGSFDGNLFTSSDGESLNGTVTATSAFDANVSASIHVIVGMLPTIVMDYEDYVNPETGEVIPAKDYWTIGKKGDPTKYFTSNNGKGGKESAEIVSIDDDEPVRFGSHSLKLNYDFRDCGAVTEGAYFGTSDTLEIPGNPTGIGVWVYAPEGTGVKWEGEGSQAGFWLRGYVTDGNGTVMPYNFTLEPKAVTGDQQPGIYWEGWKYLEADLTQLTPPFKINPGFTFRLMFVSGINMGTRTAGSIYFDNLQFVYGANVDDIDSPVIDQINMNNAPLEEGMEITTNNVSFDANFHDIENKYTSGIDANTVRMYLDGVNVAGNEKFSFVVDPDGSRAQLSDVNLLDGVHSLTVSLRDKFGNDTSETRYFTVKGENSNIPTVEVITKEDKAVLGETVTLEVRASDSTDISHNTTSFKLGKQFKDYEVTYSEQYDGTTTYNKLTDTLTLDATRKEKEASAKGVFASILDKVGIRKEASDNDLIASIKVKIPSSMKENESFNYTVKSGSYQVDDALYTYSAPEKKLPIAATYSITYDSIIVGKDGLLKVIDSNGQPAVGVTIYMEDGTELGKTDDKGELTTNRFSEASGKYVVYAKDDQGRISFLCTVLSFDANGDTAGAPYGIMNNAVKRPSNEKSISWFVHPGYVGTQSIQYKVKGAAEWQQVTAKSEVKTFTAGTNTAAAVNSVTLKGLTPNTTYQYRVGNENKWSEEKTFVTGNVERPTNFFVFGDIQADDLTNVKALLSHVNKQNFTFGIQTGDAVDDANSYADWNDIANLLGVEAMGDSDVIHVLGNHEYAGDANGSTASAIYNLPVTKAGGYYSTTYGNVYTAVINYTGTAQQMQEALEWLRADVEKSSAKWKILTLHQPPYYTNVVGGNAQINEMVPPVVDELGIDFVFSGHDHSYARTEPLKNREVDPNGATYFIAGSSGEKSYTITNNPDFHFAKATQDYNAVYIAVNAGHNDITVTAYDVAADGSAKVLDSCTKSIKVCENDEHTYLYDTETKELLCSECGYVVGAQESLYGGYAREKRSGRLMYFAGGKPVTGHQYIDGIHYYFDENGCGFEGEYIIDGQKCIFKDAKYEKCTTADVLLAGACGTKSMFILYNDGLMKIEGSGEMENHISRGTVPWAEYVTKVRKLVIGSEITGIGNYAFSYLESCREVIFEDNSKLKHINDLGFYFMSNLKSIRIPDGVETITNYAFAYDKALEMVYIPESVTFIKDTAFKYCDMARLVLNVKKGSYAESYAKANGIQFVYDEEIDPGNGKPCGENAKWEVKDGVLKITGSGALTAFYSTGYKSVPWYDVRHTIKKVEVGKYITEISTYSFRELDNCTSVVFEEGSKLYKVGSDSFRYMKSLKKLILPEGLTTISNCAFADSGLEKVYIPNSVKSIHADAFYSVNKDKLVLSVGKGSYAENYAKSKGIKYEYHDGTLPDNGQDCGPTARWEVRDGVLKITGSGELYAFYNAGYKSVPWYDVRHTIKKVEVGKDITVLSTYSFRELDNCTSVVFESGSKLYKVGSDSFRYMKNLKELTLPEGIATISNCAFADSGLEKIYIPNSVKSIHADAFYNVNKDKLILSVGKESYAETYAKSKGIKYMYHDGTLPEIGQACGPTARWEIRDGVLNITGSGELTAFYSAGYKSVPWYDIRHTIKKVVVGKDITVLSTYSFRELDNCTSVVFENGSKLYKIGSDSFRYMKNLKELKLPESLATISNCAFADSGLEKVYIPNSVKSINATAFYNVNKDKLVLSVGRGSYAEGYAETNGIKYDYHDGSLPETGNSCGQYAKWEVKDGVLKITGSGALTAFYNTGYKSVPWYDQRHTIKRVEVGRNITEISTYSFRELDSCTNVVFEEGSKLQKVGSDSFRYMRNLKELKLPEGLVTISNCAFADSGLEKVYIPNSVKSINAAAFHNVNKDKLVLSVGRGSYAETYAKTNGIKFEYSDGATLGNSGVCGKDAKWEVKDGVLKITGSGKLTAFYETGYGSVPWYHLRHEIKKVEVGKDITEISTYAFREFDNCTSVVFEEGSKLQKVGSDSFRYMKNLKELALPEGLLTISNCAFADSELEKIYIPESVKSINATAFHNVNKDKLVVSVIKGSYAETYVKENELVIVYQEKVTQEAMIEEAMPEETVSEEIVPEETITE